METVEATYRHEPTYEPQDRQEPQSEPEFCDDALRRDACLRLLWRRAQPFRSDGKYKLMGCKNGPGRRSDCKLTTSKSTRIIEGALLKYLFDAILNNANLAGLVEKANAMLEVEARRPRRDERPLTAGREAQKRTCNLLATIADEDDADVRGAYHQEVKKHRKTITELIKRSKRPEAACRSTEATYR